MNMSQDAHTDKCADMRAGMCTDMRMNILLAVLRALCGVGPAAKAFEIVRGASWRRRRHVACVVCTNVPLSVSRVQYSYKQKQLWPK